MTQTELLAMDELVEPRLVQMLASAVNQQRGGWVLLVGGGLLQLPALYAFQVLGFKVAVTDQNSDCACAEHADHMEELDTYDVTGHVAFARSWPFGWRAVYTTGADPIVTVARTAEAVGCHAVPVAIAHTCQDKFQTRVMLEEYGVPQPNFRWLSLGQLDDVHALQEFVEDIGAECVIIKATGSSGSRGHTKGNIEDFEDSWVCTSALLRAATFSPNKKVLVEELLQGVELSVETLWIDGQMIPLNVVERPFLDDPDFSLELGHYNPWIAAANKYAKVWTVAKSAGRAVGMDMLDGGHVFKIDMIYTKDGPKVLEITTRLSGGFDSGWTTPKAHGADYTRGACLLALGRKDEAMPMFAKRWHLHAAAWAVWGPREGGIIKEIKGTAMAEKLAHVFLRFEPGDVLPETVDCTTRVAFVLAVHEFRGYALALAKAAADLIEIVME